MIIIAALIVITPIEYTNMSLPVSEHAFSFAKKKRGKSSGAVRKFSSCKAARKAGYSHMRKGQPGYSPNLDRDGDGIACDKIK
jgi:hypothetical protein